MDLELLLEQLPGKLTKSTATATVVPPPVPANPIILLTGATGFLGGFCLATLLDRYPYSNVICLIRAETDELAMERLLSTCQKQRHCQSSWPVTAKITALAGDLTKHHFNLSTEQWENLTKSVNVILHCGAQVHWLYSYQQLRSANVLSTLSCLQLVSESLNCRSFCFVSSTSVLDCDDYSHPSTVVNESDLLKSSHTELASGYAQSKYVSEQLVIRARQRQLLPNNCSVTVIRPGYILGHSVSGVSNTDDFIFRILKGCLQMGIRPKGLNGHLNAVTVDDVALCCVQVMMHPELSYTNNNNGVYHIWQSNHFSFDWMFSVLDQFGYVCKDVCYEFWCQKLSELFHATTSLAISNQQSITKPQLVEENSLFPLLHFVLDNLPQKCRSVTLNDDRMNRLLRQTETKEHSRKSISSDNDTAATNELQFECNYVFSMNGHGVQRSPIDIATFSMYLSYLIEVGFLPVPEQRNSSQLPLQLPNPTLKLQQLTRHHC